MTHTFVIDSLPESAAQYRETHAMVVADVFRATSCIVTALASGHPVYPVGTMDEAFAVAERLREPILAGEQAGVKPERFDYDNSPAALESAGGTNPIVLLTSAGTLLLTNCRGATDVYVASLRNLSATADRVANHRRVALIGAGTRGQPRPEDQLVCAWIGERLLDMGFEAEDQRTMREVAEWRGADLQVLRKSPSADYLRGVGQHDDIDFVLCHVDDIPEVAVYNGQQVSLLTAAGFEEAAAAGLP
ncbi:MAG: 2-phosphosulfolactate phosphatase [Chloroflexi bacterium]|nr:MAG: 2-phosphosulfolactate phosphatase [Chloroflexota bacterium]